MVFACVTDLIFNFFDKGGKLAKVDLTASMVPETVPNWLNNYGKHVKK